MRVLGPLIDPQIAHHAPPKRPLRDHALDGLLDHPLGMPAGEDGALAAPLDPAGIAGMPIEDAGGALVAGQLHLFGIDHHDMVAAIHVRRIGWLVLAAQPHRDQGRHAPEHQPVGVDQQPFLVDIGWSGGECFHLERPASFELPDLGNHRIMVKEKAFSNNAFRQRYYNTSFAGQPWIPAFAGLAM